ncbi:hypothetical protein A2U01_0050777, partial [Trifolium medium]|nr:hypothetical protein [Trifolium medium]
SNTGSGVKLDKSQQKSTQVNPQNRSCAQRNLTWRAAQLPEAKPPQSQTLGAQRSTLGRGAQQPTKSQKPAQVLLELNMAY